MSRRWVSRSASMPMAAPRDTERQRQCEGCAVAQAGAGALQRAAELPGGERTAVQSEAVAVGPRGKAVVEDTLEILGRYADASVDHFHRDGGSARAHAHGHTFLAAGFLLGAGVLGVADHVDQDL